VTAVVSNIVSCPYCGADVIEGSDSCASCGQSLWELPLPGWALETNESQFAVPISALRTSRPLTVRPDMPIAEVLRAIAHDASGAAVVVDGDRVVGIFTDRDVLLKVAGAGSHTGPVSDYMTADPVVLRDDDLMATALHKMGSGGFRHIPLTRDGRLVSIVTARDIVTWLLGRYFDE
jgi:CBS domain-containing protein